MKKDMTPAGTSDAPRTWNSGPPPHVGWWNASNARWKGQWRWWDGVQWSDWAAPSYTAEDARAAVLRLDYEGGIEWTDYYPEGARVPRVDPNNRWIAPMLPALNAGSLYAWEEAGHRMHVTMDMRDGHTRWANTPVTLTREPISMPTPDPDRCVPRIDATTCTTQEMPKVREPIVTLDAFEENRKKLAELFRQEVPKAQPDPAPQEPTPEEDEAWRAISTGQPQNPEPRDLAEVSTRDLMTELFRRVG